MNEWLTIGEWILKGFIISLLLYLLAGLLFVGPFLWRGLDRIDPVAKKSGRGFRLIIVPGIILLWPFLLKKWKSSSHDK